MNPPRDTQANTRVNPHPHDSLMALQAWWSHRREHWRQLQAHRRARTVALGPHWQLQFEDELTVRSRLLAALGSEAAPAHTLEGWTRQVPDGTEWTATLRQTLRPEDRAEQPAALLHALLGQAVSKLYVELPGQPRVWAQVAGPASELALDGPAAHPLPAIEDEQASWQYALRFALTEPFRSAVLAGQPVSLGCAHPHAAWRRPIPAHALLRLRRELALPGRRVASPAWPGRSLALPRG